ncbi:hypothetical protein FJ364_03030, partial [Candidatus Dependentiae bacterium]|nr:hypothetical protein [Candidatus Dependentiae bacterium]
MNLLKDKLKAVIFDMDGTIIQTDHIWSIVVREYLHETGIRAFSPHDVKFLEAMSGMSMKAASKVTKNHFGLPEDAEKIAARKMELANIH